MIRRFGLFALVAVLMLAAGLRDRFDVWVDDTVLPPVLVETSVEVRDRQGQLMRVFPVEDGRVRLALGPGQVDPGFIAMLVAFEDKRFWRHHGVDPLAALRAFGQAALAGEVVSGGSTLTMQVARLLENSGTGRWQGKLRQVRVALALERRRSKEEILAMYLLHAPYGGAVEGLRAGSLAWFGKEPGRLTQAEAALLVALPQSPETRRPDRFPDAAMKARARVLERVDAPERTMLAPVPRAITPFVRLAPHLADRMRAEDPVAGIHDLTLDAGLQEQVEDLVGRAVRGQAAGVSAAIVVADHATGAILASAGSPDYSAAGGSLGFVDMTRAIRSPGSTLKPFIYGLAFDQGLAHPDTIIDDSPVAFGTYAPQNFDGRFRGELTVREALHLSLNIPPVLLTQELGPARLMASLRKGGARPVVPGGKPGLAVALGGVGMTLDDIVQLYAGLANGGVSQPLHWRQGEAGAQDAPRIMSRSAAWQVGQILAGVTPPRGVAAKSGQVAFKTGTSYGHRDAWAVGFDGRHVVGVWLGRPDGTPVPGAFGGDLAAPILFEAFGRIGPRRVPLPLPPPETLIAGTAALPLPLRRFQPRDAVFHVTDAPVVAFPPDGAVLRRDGDTIPLKLRDGVLPITVLVDGAPVLTGLRQRSASLPVGGAGFSRISVIDARGQAAQVRIRLD
jgi:penicillin-binding protein 1C